MPRVHLQFLCSLCPRKEGRAILGGWEETGEQLVTRMQVAAVGRQCLT